jgi:hypothetical protein
MISRYSYNPRGSTPVEPEYYEPEISESISVGVTTDTLEYEELVKTLGQTESISVGVTTDTLEYEELVKTLGQTESISVGVEMDTLEYEEI